MDTKQSDTARKSSMSTRFSVFGPQSASLPGSYVLLIKSGRTCAVQIGRLGLLDVRPGWYLYVGSAFGSGGLRARVGRHLNKNKTRRWHIDYLRAVTDIAEVWFCHDRRRLETAWGQALLAMPAAAIPLPGFGASDSSLPSHLIYLPTRPGLQTFLRRLGDIDYRIETFTP